MADYADDEAEVSGRDDDDLEEDDDDPDDDSDSDDDDELGLFQNSASGGHEQLFHEKENNDIRSEMEEAQQWVDEVKARAKNHGQPSAPTQPAVPRRVQQQPLASSTSFFKPFFRDPRVMRTKLFTRKKSRRVTLSTAPSSSKPKRKRVSVGQRCIYGGCTMPPMSGTMMCANHSKYVSNVKRAKKSGVIKVHSV